MKHSCLVIDFDDTEFVEERVRTIARNMHVTNGIVELAVVDAVNALKAGADRDKAIATGVASAASARDAHHARMRNARPQLRLVTCEPDLDQPPPDVLWHSPWTYALLITCALLLAASVALGPA